MAKYTCKICGNKNKNRPFVFQEMMFGTRDKFDYFQCGDCGCIQILEVPKNISDYYKNNYYSFREIKEKKSNPIKSLVKKQLLRSIFARNNILLIFIPQKYKSSVGFNWQWFRHAKVKPSSKILDVGCGSGLILNHLADYGYKNLLGIDPFIKKNIHYSNGVLILKKQITDINGNFDFIMFNHSFEHMPDPLAVFKDIYRLLNNNGKVLIRIPVASCYAWKKYKKNWVQLDPPRHLFIHTPESINILCKKAGLKIINIIYDSHNLQFYGSEQYLKGIPLLSNNSYMINPKKSIFSTNKINQFDEKTKILNRTRKGDQAAFWIKKV